MKRIKWAALAIALLAVPVFVFVGLAKAESFASFVGEDETINSTLYSAGDNVEINGTVNGDIFCAGRDIEINATVHGDVICAGMDVTIAGKIDGSVRAAGQAVDVSANVGHSITIAAQDFSLDAIATVKQDATLTGADLNVKGGIGRDLVASGDTMSINGTIGRNIKFSGAELNIRDNATIGGDVNYTSKNTASVSQKAKVAGEVNQTVPEKQQHNWMGGFAIVSYLFMLFALAVIALTVILIFPKATQDMAATTKKRWGMTLLVGFLAGFVIPVTAFVLMVTVVGIPLGIIILLLWALLAIFSAPVTAYFVGRLVLGKYANNVIPVVLLGSLILVTLCFLPFVGMLFGFISYWLGSGALLIAFRNSIPKPEYDIKKGK